MTDDDIDAALKLATAAKARADLATPGPWSDVDWLGGTSEALDAEGHLLHFGCGEANIAFVRHARTDVPTLADAVHRLAALVRTLQAILGDATQESAMYRHGYEQGVREALALVMGMIQDARNWVEMSAGLGRAHERLGTLNVVDGALRALLDRSPLAP